MRVLGVDPGMTTGWVIWDDEARRVIDSGEFPEHHIPEDMTRDWDVVVVERPIGQGATRPTMVDCGITSGIIWERLRTLQLSFHDPESPIWITRHEVKKRLTRATLKEPTVVNDTTCRQAMRTLFGEDAFKKGKPLYGVTGSHRLAALAVAVAYTLP